MTRLEPMGSVPVGEIPGTPKFFRALARRPSPVAAFLAPEEAPAPAVASRPISAALADALWRENRSWGAPEAVRESIDRLRNAAGVVVTGQQSGLLVGPAYTLYKMIQAVAVAGRMSASTGAPHVPVFWSETEDHDLAEVNRARIFGTAAPTDLAWPTGAVAPGTPVGRIPLADAHREDFSAAVEQALPGTPHTAELMSLVRGTLALSATWGEWFNRLVLSLAGEYGLVVVDSLSGAFKGAAAEAIGRIAERGGEIAAEVNAAGERLAAAGFRPQVHMVKGRLPFFLMRDGLRRRVSEQGGAVLLEGVGRMTKTELSAFLRDDPAAFSANVVSRPLLIGAVFGEALHVTGPSETAYFAQVMPLFPLLGIPSPRVLPRVNLTLVEPAAARIMEHHGLAPGEIFLPPGALAKKFVVPAGRGPFTDRFWDRWLAAATSPIGRVKGAFPVNSRAYADASRGETAIRGFIQGLRRTVEKQAERDRGMGEDRHARLMALLRPDGQPQERSCPAVQFLNRCGLALVGALRSAMPEDWREHHLLRCEGDQGTG